MIGAAGGRACYIFAMQLADVMQRLKDHEADLKQMGVESLYVFGSTIRGEQRRDSDVDMFFDYVPGHMTALKQMAIERHTSEILGCKADITTRDGVHPRLRKDIEAAALRVF